MLDIKLFRENPEIIIDSEKKRFRDTENVEKVIEYDTLWREGERKLNSLRSEKNKLSKSFKKAKEEGNFEEVVKRSKEVAAEIINKIPGVKTIDCGILEKARIIEKITPLLIGLNIKYKSHYGGLRITGIPALDKD